MISLKVARLLRGTDTNIGEPVVSKIESLGIRAKSLPNYTSSYVTQRIRVVEIPYLVHSGFLTVLLSDETFVTPQGSVQGPVAFLSIVNVLPTSSSSSQYVHFPDDTSVVVFHKGRSFFGE